jgi:hypothetical protein
VIRWKWTGMVESLSDTGTMVCGPDMSFSFETLHV